MRTGDSFLVEVGCTSTIHSRSRLNSGSGGNLRFVKWMPLVVEDGVEGWEVLGIGTKPGMQVLRLDVDDRPVMAGCGNLWLWFVCDRGEAVEVRLFASGIGPVRPETGHEHRLGIPRVNAITRFLPSGPSTFS